MSVPAGSALELRLEGIKRLSNRYFEAIEGFYDGSPIGEKYLKFHADLHVHFLTCGRMFCAQYSARNIEEAKPRSVSEHFGNDVSYLKHQASMFVWVGEITESLRPVASIVRLQLLDCCNVNIRKSSQPSAFAPVKTLRAVLDRKLTGVDNLAAIKDREFINKIIESGSEVIANLATQDAKFEWNPETLCEDRSELPRKIRIGLYGNSILLFASEDFDTLHEIIDVFLRPRDAGDCAF